MGIDKLHDAVMAEIDELLLHGKKRITVLMPTGLGKTTIMKRLIGSLQFTTYVITSWQTIRDYLMHSEEKVNSAQSMTILSAEETDKFNNRYFGEFLWT